MTTPVCPAAIDPAPTVAVLGIGMMGWPIARRLCMAGCHVSAWNRSKAKAQRLSALGAYVADTPDQAVAQADIVLTLLENGAAVHEVLFALGTASALRPGTLLIDMSSIEPRQAREHAAALAVRGVEHLDAPVSGGTTGAEEGSLAIMVGGPSATFERARSVLELLGRPTHVGPSGTGQLAKLANQMIVGITIGAVAEALLLCEKGGADVARVKQAITGGFADSRVLHVHGQRMLDRDFSKRAALSVQLKDLRNALNTAGELGFDAPITTLFEQLFAQAAQNGFGELDHAGLFVELARRNGIAAAT